MPKKEKSFYVFWLTDAVASAYIGASDQPATAAHGGETQMDSEWTQVSKDRFYALVGSLNVHPRPTPDCSIWETPNREVLGISTPGYKCEGPTTYKISSRLFPNERAVS